MNAPARLQVQPIEDLVWYYEQSAGAVGLSSPHEALLFLCLTSIPHGSALPDKTPSPYQMASARRQIHCIRALEEIGPRHRTVLDAAYSGVRIVSPELQAAAGELAARVIQLAGDRTVCKRVLRGLRSRATPEQQAEADEIIVLANTVIRTATADFEAAFGESRREYRELCEARCVGQRHGDERRPLPDPRRVPLQPVGGRGHVDKRWDGQLERSVRRAPTYAGRPWALYVGNIAIMCGSRSECDDVAAQLSDEQANDLAVVAEKDRPWDRHGAEVALHDPTEREVAV